MALITKLKNPVFTFKEGGLRKTGGLEGELPNNWGFRQFEDLKVAWQERRGDVFEGG